MQRNNLSVTNKLIHFWHGVWTFALRDIKTRYAGSVLGIVWILLYPISMALITSVVFALAFKKTVEQIPYFLYTLAGFSAWIFFVQSVISATRSLVQNRDIVVNNNLRTEFILGGLILSRAVDFIITTIFLIIIAIIFRVFYFNLIIFIESVLVLLLITINISLITAAGNVYFRDLQVLIDIILNILFYATPIIYPLNAIPKKYLWIFCLNPLTSIFSGFRASIFHIPFSNLVLNCILLGLLILTYIIFIIYKKIEKNFAQFL